MKARKEKFIFMIIATFFALSIFAVSVFATTRLSAELSGSFNFSVPLDNFTFRVQATASGSRNDINPFDYHFNHFNTISSWNLSDLNFQENSAGEIDDIVFEFNLINENVTITERTGRVRVSYLLVNIDDEIELTPSQNLQNSIVLEPLSNDEEDPTQTDNKASFTITLSPQNKSPNATLVGARFEFKILFEFV